MTGRSKVPDQTLAAMGVSTHSGWVAFVVLAGNPRAPAILERSRMVLCDADFEGAKQPFHHAEPMPFAEAQEFIALCQARTAKLARAAIAPLAKKGVRTCCVLTASGRALPGLKEILASHSCIHAAEGEFYRDAIVSACEAAGITAQRIRSRDLDVEMQKLPVSHAAAKERLAAFGAAMGAPWTTDEKQSALGAWLMLAQSSGVKPDRRFKGS
jgi:hypothetical protein